MAELNARIIAKASATASEQPQASDLQVAELAVNTADGKLFTKHTDGSVVTISGGGGATTLDELTDVDTTGVTDNQVLTYVTTPGVYPSGEFIVTAAGGVIEDISSNTLTITNNNGVGIANDGVSGDCLDFSTASNAYCTIADDAVFGLGGGDFTIEFSFKYTAGGSSAYVLPITKRIGSDPSQGDFSVVLQSDTGNLGITLSNGISNDFIVSPFGTRDEGVWYHVAIVRSGNTVTMYKDGVSIGSDSYARDVTRSSAPVRLGATESGSSGSFKLDNLRISKTAVYTSTFTPPTDFAYQPPYSQWEPVDAASGAVDSVNGKTGVVSLGIEDMDDVDTSGVIGILSYSVNDTQAIGAASTGTQNASTAAGSVYWDFSPTDQNSVDQSAFWDARVTDASNGILPTLQYKDGGQTYYFSPTGISLQNGIYRVFAPSANSPVLPPSTRDNTVTFIDIRDGQVLTWNASSGKWESADAPSGGSGGGAVNSVNGQTGAVSLGIQDMDDFELQPASADPVFQWVYQGTKSTSTPVSGEACSLSNSSYLNYLFVANIGNDGQNKRDALLAISGEEVLISWSGGQWGPGVATIATNGASSVSFVLDSNWADVANRPGVGALITITRPGLPTVPLTEGDILQWNETQQKFVPAQPSSGTGGSVDSVNSQTGAVSLGIQDMDDFDYQYSGTPGFTSLQKSGTWSNWMDAHSNPPGYEFPESQGEWRAYKNTAEGKGSLQLATLDDNSNSSEDWVSVSIVNLQMALRIDGNNYGPIPVTAITDSAAYGVFIEWDINDFDPSQYGWGYELGNPEASPTSPRPNRPITVQLGYGYQASLKVDLREGEILQWDDSLNKFKPAQLSINELADVAYDLEPPASWNLTPLADQLGGMTSGKGYEGNGSIAVSPFSSQGDDLRTDARAWVATLTFPVDLTYVFNGVETVVNTTGTTDQWDDTGAYKPRFFFNGGTFAEDVHAGQSFYIKEFADYQGTRATLPPSDREVLIYDSLSGAWRPDSVAFNELKGVDTSTTPPRDGQLLKWNDTDSKWEPGSPGNIQDLDNVDYPYGSTPSWNLTPTADQLGGMTSGKGYEAADSIAIHPTDAQATDRKSDLRAWAASLTLPTSITLLFDGVETVVNMTGTTDQADETGGYQPRFFILFDGAASDAHANQTFQIKEFTEYLGIVNNPTDGQVLTWDNANSQWKPADVPGGIGAVDSVNGQTGAVSLGIQDMDDFSTLEASSVSGPVVWDEFVNSGGAARSGDGQYGTGNIGNDRFVQVASKAADGTDYASFFDSIVINGGVSELGIKSQAAAGGTEYSYFTLASIIKNDDAGYTNPLYLLRVLDPSDEFTFHYSGIDLDFSRVKTGIDLAEGDILQWDNSDQKFKPAQLPSGGIDGGTFGSG